MAKIYVFGIGGTGARVLRSLTMMLASGVQLGQDEIVPIFIDPDESNADLSRTVDLMNLYIRIHRDLTFHLLTRTGSLGQRLAKKSLVLDCR